MSFTLCALCALLLAHDAASSADGATSADGAAPGQAVDAADAGSAPATPIAPIAPVEHHPTSTGIAMSGVTTSEPVVALTFDACATKKQANGFDRKVFEILAREQIPATFYLSGRWVERHPSAAKVIAAAPWIELGNHTYSHPRLTLMRKERIRLQIQRTNTILERKLGRAALSLRPPAGAWNAKVVRIANEEHLPVVLWSIISGDAGGHVPAARMDRAVLEQAKPGAIIIFHINKRAPFTKKALPDIIAGLREKGFRFVTVSQLLDLPDAVPIKAKPSRFGFRPRNKPPSPEQKEQGDDHADPPT
ncbi:MAG TPA: polysaccharide deacetylase family protein [Polyangia bacterium]